MVAGDGIEPPLLAKETSVLPLHYPAAIKDRGAEAYRGTFWWAVLIHAQDHEKEDIKMREQFIVMLRTIFRKETKNETCLTLPHYHYTLYFFPVGCNIIKMCDFLRPHTQNVTCVASM